MFPIEYSEREGQGVSSRERAAGLCSLLVRIAERAARRNARRLKTCRREIQRNTRGFPFRSAPEAGAIRRRRVQDRCSFLSFYSVPV